jgi:hypothetical protein
VAELRTLRDRSLPQALLRNAELRGRYIQFAKNGEAEERIVADALNGLENGIKVQRKELDALLDDTLLLAKHDAEADLRLRVARNPELAAAASWARIEAAQAGVSAGCRTRSSRKARVSTAACFASPACSCAGRRNGRSRTRSAYANTRTPRCRARNSSSRLRCRSIPSSSV